MLLLSPGVKENYTLCCNNVHAQEEEQHKLRALQEQEEMSVMSKQPSETGVSDDVDESELAAKTGETVKRFAQLVDGFDLPSLLLGIAFL